MTKQGDSDVFSVRTAFFGEIAEHLVSCHLTDEGVLVELLQVRRGLRRPVDDLAVIDIGLREILRRRVGSVSMLDHT